ncbi:putative lipoprotein [Vibrio metoecus]|nr:putative lipoprotein [Vibrio metoecus]
MKKSLMVLTVMIALVGCDDATKAIDEAQAAANKAVDNLQQKADSLNLQDLNLDVLGDATQKAQSALCSQCVLTNASRGTVNA